MLTATTSRRRRWIWPTAVATALILALGGFLAYRALAPNTITVAGTVSVDPDPGHVPCTTTPVGIEDIRAGAQVVISDAAGNTIAIGQLQQGLVVGPDAGGGYTCSFGFSVQAPGGLDFYGVEISHRGRLQYPRAELNRPIALTLGR